MRILLCLPITSMALSILDLPLRSYRALLALKPQNCFVLSDMVLESGEMSRTSCVRPRSVRNVENYAPRLRR